MFCGFHSKFSGLAWKFPLYFSYACCVLFFFLLSSAVRRKAGKRGSVKHFCSTFTGNEGREKGWTTIDAILRAMTTVLPTSRDNPLRILWSHRKKYLFGWGEERTSCRCYFASVLESWKKEALPKICPKRGILKFRPIVEMWLSSTLVCFGLFEISQINLSWITLHRVVHTIFCSNVDTCSIFWPCPVLYFNNRVICSHEIYMTLGYLLL